MIKLLNILVNAGHFLNYYANLLLVLITAVYAWLTWRSLKAFRESTLRDREARHLEDIKHYVIQPIVSWINLTALDRFSGSRSPELLCIASGLDGGRRVSHTVDDPFVGRHRLMVPGDPDVLDPLATWDTTESGRVSEFLYEHAKRDHFRRELSEFGGLLEDVRKLTGAVVSLANECAKDIAGSEIPQARTSDEENKLPEWTNPHLLAAVCIESLLLEKSRPSTEVRQFSGFHLLVDTRNGAIARAIEADRLKCWSELAFEQVRNRWERLKLPESVRNLLKDASTARQNVGQLMFTQTLAVDCELVSGKTRWWRKLGLRNA
jgi:hypothetical protein